MTLTLKNILVRRLFLAENPEKHKDEIHVSWVALSWLALAGPGLQALWLSGSLLSLALSLDLYTLWLFLGLSPCLWLLGGQCNQTLWDHCLP